MHLVFRISFCVCPCARIPILYHIIIGIIVIRRRYTGTHFGCLLWCIRQYYYSIIIICIVFYLHLIHVFCRGFVFFLSSSVSPADDTPSSTSTAQFIGHWSLVIVLIIIYIINNSHANVLQCNANNTDEIRWCDVLSGCVCVFRSSSTHVHFNGLRAQSTPWSLCIYC